MFEGQSIVKGSTSNRYSVFLQDSSKSDGSGLTGLVHNSTGLKWYYLRDGAAVPTTAVTIVTATVGTYASGGFKEVDATNMPGTYEIGIPDAAVIHGADFLSMFIRGAANLAVRPIRIPLVGGVSIRGSVSDVTPAAGDFDGDSSLSATDDFYVGALLVFTQGTLKGAAREISDYTGSSKRFQFTGTGSDLDRVFPSAPANGDEFEIIGLGDA